MHEKELADIIGAANVFGSPDVLEELSGDLSLVNHVRPGCVARPGNVDELQQLVKWANEVHIPLVPVSSDAPHFRGDTVPSTGGAVILDLGRMNKIIRIDPVN